MDLELQAVAYDARPTAVLIEEIQLEMTARYGGPDASSVRSRTARAMGYRRLVLETGLEQPEAIALYESAGYRPEPPFGYDADAPLSRSYGKDLLDQGPDQVNIRRG